MKVASIGNVRKRESASRLLGVELKSGEVTVGESNNDELTLCEMG